VGELVVERLQAEVARLEEDRDMAIEQARAQAEHRAAEEKREAELRDMYGDAHVFTGGPPAIRF
jgi:hypothetical protein